MAKVYRIHPGIGIARVGNSVNEYFVGPESSVSLGADTYRDTQGFLKRQAARFRVYEYEYDSFGRQIAVQEVTEPSARIRWMVHLANTKASAERFPPGSGIRRNPDTPIDELNIDAGIQEVSGPNAVVLLAGQFKGTEVNLGELRTDRLGRLVALGGKGESKSVPPGQPLHHFANNPNWYDDVSDGPVRATVQFNDAEPVTCDPAWLIVAPPAYAPAIRNVVTLWDQAVNVAAQIDPSFRASVSPASFTRDIYPILRRTVLLQWVSKVANSGHGDGTGGDFLESTRLSNLSSNHSQHREAREAVYNRLRGTGGGSNRNMPRLKAGLAPDDPTTTTNAELTEFQLELMDDWRIGQFTSDWTGVAPTPQPLEDFPLPDQPAELDKAALDACIGGPFYPGIEAGYLLARRDTYRTPFRVDDSGFQAGSITAGLACPWQADFSACSQLWWPAQRPNWVIRAGNRVRWVPAEWTAGDMVADWSQLRMIVEAGNRFVEEDLVP